MTTIMASQQQDLYLCVICQNTSGERAYLWIDRCGHGFCNGCLIRNRNYNGNRCPHCRQFYKSKSIKPYKTGPADMATHEVVDLTKGDGGG